MVAQPKVGHFRRFAVSFGLAFGVRQVGEGERAAQSLQVKALDVLEAALQQGQGTRKQGGVHGGGVARGAQRARQLVILLENLSKRSVVQDDKVHQPLQAQRKVEAEPPKPNLCGMRRHLLRKRRQRLRFLLHRVHQKPDVPLCLLLDLLRRICLLTARLPSLLGHCCSCGALPCLRVGTQLPQKHRSPAAPPHRHSSSGVHRRLGALRVKPAEGVLRDSHFVQRLRGMPRSMCGTVFCGGKLLLAYRTLQRAPAEPHAPRDGHSKKLVESLHKVFRGRRDASQKLVHPHHLRQQLLHKEQLHLSQLRIQPSAKEIIGAAASLQKLFNVGLLRQVDAVRGHSHRGPH
eukprot:RCo033257